MRIIGDKNGFVGINLYPSFLFDSGSADEDSIMAHIDHALNIAGENCVGFGTDFDGINSTPEGYGNVLDMAKLYRRLVQVCNRNIAGKIIGDY